MSTTNRPTRSRDFSDHIGETFGQLTILERAGADRFKTVLVRCRCSCGAEPIMRRSAVTNGHLTRCADNSAHRRIDSPAYKAVHDRIRTEFGPAKDHACFDCQGRAAEWSYTGEGTHSTDLSLYVPRCITCHRNFDTERAGRRSKPCAIDGCKSISDARGMCVRHYSAWRRAAISAGNWPPPTNDYANDLFGATA